MTDSLASLVAAVAATFFFAGIVKGVTGMGLPTVAMGVLGAILSPVAAAALLVVPSFVTNVWQLLSGPDLKSIVLRLWPMMAGIVVGTLAGASLLTGGNVRWTTTALGIVLVVYAVYTLLARQPRVPAGAERWLSPIVGLATGAVTGATGVFVIPAVPYLQALGLGRDGLVQALGLSFTVSTVALAVGLAWNGAFALDNAAISVLAVLPALVGMRVGQAIRTTVDPATFRRWFLIFLLLLGAELALRPVLRLLLA